jgi:transformation/transcription domain-associated protein
VSHLKPYQDAIADAVLALMQNCPSDDSVTRKELLVATRHILFTDFRFPFLRHVDLLLDENILVGHGLTSRETLRYFVFFTFLDR